MTCPSGLRPVELTATWSGRPPADSRVVVAGGSGAADVDSWTDEQPHVHPPTTTAPATWAVGSGPTPAVSQDSCRCSAADGGLGRSRSRNAGSPGGVSPGTRAV